MVSRRHDSFINFEGLERLQNELGRLFEGDWIKAGTAGEFSEWRPSADIVESESQVQVVIDLPGVAIESIDVTLDRGVLSVSGERMITTGDANPISSQTDRRERPSGKFKRRFNLPDGADESTIKASANDGVLTISLQMGSVSSARSVPVNRS